MIPLVRDIVAEPIPLADLARWVELANMLADSRLPVMGFAGHVVPLLSRSRCGRMAANHLGTISCAVATTIAMPSDPRAVDELRLAVAQLPDPALVAYEQLLVEIRPIVGDICLAERLGRSGSLAIPWTIQYIPEGVDGSYIPRVLIQMRQPKHPVS